MSLIPAAGSTRRQEARRTVGISGRVYRTAAQPRAPPLPSAQILCSGTQRRRMPYLLLIPAAGSTRLQEAPKAVGISGQVYLTATQPPARPSPQFWNQWPRYVLFVTDPSGGVYTTSGSAESGWDQWTSVSDGRAAPGTSVTAVREPFSYRNRSWFDVFITDPSGEVWLTSGSPESWGPWTRVSNGRAAPGTTVTSDQMPFPLRQLFITNPDGMVYTTTGSAESGWAEWKPVSDGRAAPGTTVASAYPWRALFITDPGGGVVYTTLEHAPTDWRSWVSVSDGPRGAGNSRHRPPRCLEIPVSISPVHHQSRRCGLLCLGFRVVIAAPYELPG